MKKIIALLTLLAFATACNHYPPASENLENLKKIQLGMTKAQVLDVMGDAHQGEGEFKRDPNILWYYTRTVWSDGNVSTEECTPLCFHPKTGLLVGWGHEFRQKYFLYGDFHRDNWSAPEYVEPARR